MQISLQSLPSTLHASVTHVAYTADEVFYWAQNQVHEGPMGPEFGKASPIGLLVIVSFSPSPVEVPPSARVCGRSWFGSF